MSKSEVGDTLHIVVSHEELNLNNSMELADRGQKGEKSPLEKRVIRKADAVIIPLAALAYFASYLDRNCIGNAKVMGLVVDLKLTAGEFYNCVTMVFVGYIIMLLPANLLNRKLKPNRTIGSAVVFFGVMLCAMSAAKNYATIVALRLLIGCGASFVPILTLYTSLYYTRDELATRNGKSPWRPSQHRSLLMHIAAIYYAAATTSGAFGGVLAYGIQHNLTYKATGRRPWEWLFLIEGVLGILVGLAIWIFLPRYPDDLQGRGKKHWLFTADEIAAAAKRSATYNTGGAKIQTVQLIAALKDPKTYLFAMCQSASVLGVGVVGSFLPIFIQDFGFSALNAQLFTVIPYACAFFSVLFVGIVSDRVNKKGPFLLAGYCIGCLGYIILLSTRNSVASMIAACMVTSGCYAAVILLPVWIAINTGGFTKRGATWAFSETAGLCFSVMGTRIYTSPPRYIKGHSIVLAFNVVAALSSIANMLWMARQNKIKERIEKEYAERNEVHPHIFSNASLEDVYDYHISFRYIW